MQKSVPVTSTPPTIISQPCPTRTTPHLPEDDSVPSRKYNFHINPQINLSSCRS